MDNLIQYVTAHQFTVWVGVFVALLIVYVIFKKLIKLALLLTLLLLAIGGYMYFKDPKRMPGNIQEALQKAKEKTVKVVETGKGVYDKGKAVAEKGVIYSKELREFIKDGKETTKER
ncbi:MAG: hypothetical protein WCH07_05095 [Deltaproteobacteria bacterium]